MSQKIILFSIGSIQSFIINSRKVSDLFNSSRILSELISTGINFIENKGKSELLLPQVLEDDKSLPNYFIIKYESDRYLGKETEKCVREKYTNILMDNSIKSSLEKHKHQIEKQLDSSLDIYWVEYDLEESFDLKDSNKYKQVYDEIYKYFEAVKNIKKFSNICEEGKKCSICGTRNAIIVNSKNRKEPFGIQKIYKYQDLEEDSFLKLIEKLRNKGINLSLDEIEKIKKDTGKNHLESKDIDIKLKENEMLCAPCLLKRIYDIEERIPSLAQITLSNWIENEKKSLKCNAYNKYKETIDELNKIDCNFDVYEFMYKENWDKVLKNIKIKDLEKKIKALEESFENLNNSNIPKYYCMYRMDIDNLGKWMSGKYKTSEKNLYEYQKELSLKISNFFNKVKEHFENKFIGKLVYAGGDDLLALIPVDEIFKLEQNISIYFEEEVQSGEYKDITYSKGIFVAHYKTPLGEITRVSKEELEKVKEKFNKRINDFDKEKNATVISIMTEGYSNRSVYFKNNLNGEKTIEFILKELMNYFNKDKSTYFHNQLQNEFLDFDKNLEKDYQKDMILNMFGVEQKRMMKRSILKDSIADEMIDNINNKLIDFLKVNSSKELKIDFENYFNLFHIIRKLKQNLEVK